MLEDLVGPNDDNIFVRIGEGHIVESGENSKIDSTLALSLGDKVKHITSRRKCGIKEAKKN